MKFIDSIQFRKDKEVYNGFNTIFKDIPLEWQKEYLYSDVSYHRTSAVRMFLGYDNRIRIIFDNFSRSNFSKPKIVNRKIEII